MNQILVIAWREITRLRKRFGGGASPLAVLALLAVLGGSSYFLRDAVSLGSGLYRVGVMGNVPTINDSRFAVMEVNEEQGRALLEQKAIDLLIIDSQVIAREDDKSQFAVRALKQYMEAEELNRVGNSFSEADAFPLRVAINYLGAEQAPVQGEAGGTLPTVKPEEVIIPSLTPPPAPFTQVLVALLYILPITFISIFFTSSFMDEKMNRRLTILLSAPVSPFQIIFGKMLPYAIFALVSTALIAALTKTNIPLALAIFAPTTLFIFAIYLMVPLFYRTFKDTTFIAMLVTTLTTAYLVFPAMFTNVNDLAYISPLTLAVKMYRGEPFGWREYLFPSLPMAAIFGFAMFAGTRMLNEEFLMGYKPLTRKIKDAIYLMMAHAKPSIAVPLWSLIVIPAVYMTQIVFLAFATNLPVGLILGFTLIASALVEEVVKTIGIVVLAERGVVKTWREVIGLSFLSALGFLIGEKLLLLVSISMVSEAQVSGALFGAGLLLFVPLAAHFVFVTIVTVMAAKWRVPYWLALGVGTILHFIYNVNVMRGGM
ncbi:MAG TPA: ABC transporter permease subunit [Anaerolineales bacterium]|nr:ABC transporter permease subunit [Anaerolineales bacterium]HMX73627.1 ABC transporter permease subunit [Anaerolineales bacterium]HNB87459.1 ABC transporter permease subunit [Anaerolineales bacterium]HNE68382.1 ABC transporter permease subunit [Anaerolineales bacterium]HNF35552.1 ABC transporter permease subunit [Anaerolineales bacterium]